MGTFLVKVLVLAAVVAATDDVVAVVVGVAAGTSLIIAVIADAFLPRPIPFSCYKSNYFADYFVQNA